MKRKVYEVYQHCGEDGYCPVNVFSTAKTARKYARRIKRDALARIKAGGYWNGPQPGTKEAREWGFTGQFVREGMRPVWLKRVYVSKGIPARDYWKELQKEWNEEQNSYKKARTIRANQLPVLQAS